MDNTSIDRSTSEALNSVYRLIVDGDLVSASMMAQEVLSDILGQWRHINSDSSEPDVQRLSGSLLLVSTAYAETLLKQQQPKAAYNAVMTALAYTARVEVADAGAVLMALNTAWACVEQTLNGSAPADETQRDAIHTVAEGLASLLYRQYYITGRRDPENGALTDAYDSLRVLQSLVTISPQVDDAVLLLGKVLNASQAAGLIE